jgi:hypothetical protein
MGVAKNWGLTRGEGREVSRAGQCFKEIRPVCWEKILGRSPARLEKNLVEIKSRSVLGWAIGTGGARVREEDTK